MKTKEARKESLSLWFLGRLTGRQRPFETLQLCWCLFKCKHLSVSFSPCQQRNLYLDEKKKKRFKDKIWKLSDTNYRNIDIQTFLVVKLKAARWVDFESRFVERLESNFLATEWVSWKWIRGVAVDVEWKMCDAVVFPRKEVENVAFRRIKKELMGKMVAGT